MLLNQCIMRKVCYHILFVFGEMLIIKKRFYHFSPRESAPIYKTEYFIVKSQIALPILSNMRQVCYQTCL